MRPLLAPGFAYPHLDNDDFHQGQYLPILSWIVKAYCSFGKYFEYFIRNQSTTVHGTIASGLVGLPYPIS